MVDLIELIDGCLLGDGFLALRRASGWRNARFGFASTRSLTLLKQLQSWLEYYGFRYQIRDIGTDYQQLVTGLDPFFTAMWRRWYRNGKKTIPQDVRLTPLSLLLWYLGDGTISNDKRKWGKSELYLASVWPVEEAKFLQQKLLDEQDLHFGLVRRKTYRPEHYNLRLSRSDLSKFFTIIGTKPPPWAPELSYKWEVFYQNPKNFY